MRKCWGKMYFHLVTSAFYLPWQKMLKFEGCFISFFSCFIIKYIHLVLLEYTWYILISGKNIHNMHFFIIFGINYVKSCLPKRNLLDTTISLISISLIEIWLLYWWNLYSLISVSSNFIIFYSFLYMVLIFVIFLYFFYFFPEVNFYSLTKEFSKSLLRVIKGFFSFCNISFSTQQAFVFHLLRD